MSLSDERAAQDSSCEGWKQRAPKGEDGEQMKTFFLCCYGGIDIFLPCIFFSRLGCPSHWVSSSHLRVHTLQGDLLASAPARRPTY